MRGFDLEASKFDVVHLIKPYHISPNSTWCGIPGYRLRSGETACALSFVEYVTCEACKESSAMYLLKRVSHGEL